MFTLYILHIYRSALQGMGNTVMPMVSGVAEFVMRTGSALLLPGLITAEIGLLKKKWFGVNALGYVYILQFLYAAVNIYILLQVNVTAFETILSAVEMLLLFILTRIYYKKRRKIFS